MSWLSQINWSLVASMGIGATIAALVLNYIKSVGSRHISAIYTWVLGRFSVYYTHFMTKIKAKLWPKPKTVFDLKVVGIFSSVNVYYKDGDK